MMKRILIFLLVLISTLALAYFSGPKAEFEQVDNTPIKINFPIQKLDQMISQREAKIDGIKTDNECQFIWVDSLNKTEYSVVYLHGFSASHGEAQPILTNFAAKYNCNTYLPRLAFHGLEDEDAFVNLSPKALVDSAREAIAIGKSIGNKLIIISTSTGSTLACYLAANDPEIEAIICTSPNFDLYDSRSRLIVGPWGKKLLRKMMGGDYRQWTSKNDNINRYWTTKNRIEAHIALRSLLDQTMTEKTFASIKQPFYVAYYYKDDDNKDKIISIDAIQEFTSYLATPMEQVVVKPIDNARGHVISSKYMNKNWKDVQNSIFSFAENVIGMKPVEGIQEEMLYSNSDTGFNM